MFENLNTEISKDSLEIQKNVLISILSSLFCFLSVKLFSSYGYILIAYISSIGINAYGVITFYYILSFYELKERENESLSLFIKGMMYIGIFLLFLVIFSQLINVSSIVKENKSAAIPSLIIGVAVIFLPKILWSEIKGFIKKEDMEEMTPLFIPILNITQNTNAMAIYKILEKRINPQILPKVITILYNFAEKLGLNSFQANIFVPSVILAFFYFIIRFLEVIIKWILFLLVLGLVISVMTGIL